MLTPAFLKMVQENHNRWETVINWMYLDSEGYITVGCGTLLATAASAIPVSFYHEKKFAPATAMEIEAAWKKLNQGASKQKQAPGKQKRSAKTYEKETDLRVTNKTAFALRDTHIKNDYQQLKQIYPNFDTFPEKARLALFDMIYNLGGGRYKTAQQRASGLRQYINMNNAINKEDWKAAALACFRNGISIERNSETATLFRSCAVERSGSSKKVMTA